MDFPRYIVVEGPIGVGKTTLVKLFAERFNGKMVLEVFEENPFLPLFYKDPKRYAFQTEMFFLLSRYRQQQTFLQQELFFTHTFSDYLFVKSRLFASLTLYGDELTLFNQVHSLLNERLARPDLVIHLKAPLEKLLERIKTRGRSYEKDIQPDYLKQVVEIYNEYFHRYNDSPLLVIDTSHINFQQQHEFELLVNVAEKIKSGRWFYGRERKPQKILSHLSE